MILDHLGRPFVIHEYYPIRLLERARAKLLFRAFGRSVIADKTLPLLVDQRGRWLKRTGLSGIYRWRRYK